MSKYISKSIDTDILQIISLLLMSIKGLILIRCRNNNMLFKAILAFLILSTLAATDFTVTIANTLINALTDYSWAVNFAPIASRSTITLTFPTNVTVTNISEVTWNGVTLPKTASTTTSISFTATALAAESSILLKVSNIRNPPTAMIANYNFTLTSSLETVAMLNVYSVSYSSAVMGSCIWSFSLCTQQPNSELSINLTTTNKIYSGSNQVIVGYAAVWANHNSKNLMFQVTTFSCAYSLDGITYNSTSVSCANNQVTNKITVSFVLATQLPGGSQLYFKIYGVQSPPTAITATTSSYFVSTADSFGYLIDTLAGCTINPICITSVTNGVLDSIAGLYVGQSISQQDITFMSYPIITSLPSDVVWIQYSPQTNLVGCNTLKYWRLFENVKTLSVFNPSNYSFTFPSGTYQIIDTAEPITLYMICTAFIMPNTIAAKPITFHFSRGGSEYLQLTASIVVMAVGFDLSTASLVLSNTQMVNTNTSYLFTFNISQPLTNNSAVRIGFHTDINIAAVTCTLTINGTTIPSTCSPIGNVLVLNISASLSSISSGSQFQITVNSVTNAVYPQLYNFSLQTFSNSSDVSSKVQSSSPAFNTTFTTIISLIPSLNPNAFSLYSTYQLNISLSTPIPLPANSNFSLSFPAELSQLTCSAQPLFINGIQQAISNLLINSTANTISFTRSTAITVNSMLVVAITFRSPALLNTYYYVNLQINNTVPYIQCLNQLTINVNIPTTMPAGIVALTPTTAQQSSYNITLTYTVPHPATFYLSIDLPSDTTYVAAVGLCSPNCSVSGFASNGSQVTLTINNPNPNSNTIFTQTYTVSTFINRRFVAAGASANITTFVNTTTAGVITKQSALIAITSPGLLVGYLDPNVPYTRNNSAIVDLFLNLTVPILSGDYFFITMDRTTYDGFNVGCSLFFGTCTADPLSTTNVLIIKIIPNVSTYSGNPWHIKLQNLTSGAITSYLQTDLITVNHLCSGGLIETGKVTYQISCNSGAALPNQCRTCYTNGSCIDCYSSMGYYLLNNSCVTSCGNPTSFLRYADNITSVCQLCTGNCLTCINATACMSCVDNTFYLYTDTLACKLTCPLYGGYVNSTLGTQLVCLPCADPFCLHCTSTVYGSCTQCNNISTLNNGICSNTCPSISYYILNSQCMLCDTSCYSCFSAGSMSCLRCASGYANVSANCTNGCPIGTAFITNLATCGCDTPCLTCSSMNYLNCLTCLNASYFVYLGQCLGSCPSGSYQQNNNCVVCPTGCSNCSSTVCLTCLTGWKLYNSVCYSDCNQISQQYDISGSTCVVCPQGCDTCSGSVCSSCIKDYSLDGSSCISACLLSNSCAVDTSKIVPLPATMTLMVWCGVIMLLRFVSQSKNYIPYSIIAVSGIIQFTELIVCLILSKPNPTRLLFSVSSAMTVTGLLLSSLILNYLFNLIYIFIFLRYIKPLIYKPKQSDLITHGVVMAIATLTSFRFGLLAYSKLCAKPAVRIENSSRITPVHYLCIVCVIFDLLPIIACGLVLYTQQKWTPLFMLCLDLLIIIIVNIIITICFVASQKPDEYYQDKVKYGVGDENATHENMSNNENGDKDNSKVHIVAIEEFEDNHDRYASRINQVQKIDLDNERYKSIRVTKTKVNPGKARISQKYMEESYTSGKIKQDKIIENQQLEDAAEHPYANSKDVFAKQFEDADFEEIAPSKIKARENYGNSKVTSLRASPRPSKYIDSRVENRDRLAFTLDKQLDEEDHQKKANHLNVFEPTFEEESDFPELQEESMKGNKTKISDKTASVAKQKSENLHQSQLIKPILKQKERTENDRYARKERDRNNMSSILPRGVSHNKNSKKVPQKPQTLDINRVQRESEVTDQKQLQQDDFQSIVRQKVQQSSIHKKYETNLFEEDGQLEDISPSKFNAANQRFRQNKQK